MESTASTIKFLTSPEFQVSSGSGIDQKIPAAAENVEKWWDFNATSGEQSWICPTIIVNITKPLYYVSESEEKVLQRSLLRSASIIDTGSLVD